MDNKSLHILIDKYFDANTSVEEERLLLKEVLQLEGKDPLADEVLAVMGYARNKPIKHRIPQIWKIAGIAAAVIAIGIGGISLFRPYLKPATSVMHTLMVLELKIKLTFRT